MIIRARQESESYRKLGLFGSNRNRGFRCNFPEKTYTKPARIAPPVSQPAQVQYRQIDIWIISGKIGFECISAQAEGFLKAVGRKPSGEGSTVLSASGWAI
jgi:hypothetical protein